MGGGRFWENLGVCPWGSENQWFGKKAIKNLIKNNLLDFLLNRQILSFLKHGDDPYILLSFVMLIFQEFFIDLALNIFKED